MKLIFNQRGIALLIVLSSLMILTVAVIEFVYSSRIHYRLAIDAQHQLQAYYLAKSGLCFAKIILKYNQQAQKQAAEAAKQMGSFSVEPIYKMFPLSSSLFRGMIETKGLEEQTESLTGEEGGDEEFNQEGMPVKNLLSEKETKEFLAFDGDFSAEISEEDTKLNLNQMNTILSSSPAYDQYKRLLQSILELKIFEKFFVDETQSRDQLVHNLSDWVDPNEVINEFDNIQRGNENSEYSGQDYTVKNGKFLTLSELRLVTGMKDDLLTRLRTFVTIYGNSEKINACLAEDDVLKILIYHYTQNAHCTNPIKYEDEKMDELVSLVKANCPKPDDSAIALNTELGLVDLEQSFAEEDSSANQAANSTVSGCEFQFKDLLSDTNKTFVVKGTGEVGEAIVHIQVVINTESDDPTKWKYYYYRVD